MRCYLYQVVIVGCDESRRMIGHGSCKEILSLSPPTLNGKDAIQWLDFNDNNISRLCHFSKPHIIVKFQPCKILFEFIIWILVGTVKLNEQKQPLLRLNCVALANEFQLKPRGGNHCTILRVKTLLGLCLSMLTLSSVTAAARVRDLNRTRERKVNHESRGVRLIRQQLRANQILVPANLSE